jgi:hypothetical protein
MQLFVSVGASLITTWSSLYIYIYVMWVKRESVSIYVGLLMFFSVKNLIDNYYIINIHLMYEKSQEINIWGWKINKSKVESCQVRDCGYYEKYNE